MKLMLSGEGKTDMGQMGSGATGLEYYPGPMAYIVDRLIEERLNYSLLETHATGGECVRFVSEADIAAGGKRGPKLLAGIRHGKGNSFFTRNAQVLGLLAKDEQATSGQPVVAVLFRDADSTASTLRGEWQDKVDSIKRGFALAEFQTGVPMVPRPKSEAWLLCGLKQQPYTFCEALENAPGNDGSPRSLKVQLCNRVGHEPAAEEQSEWIKSGKIDPSQIQMHSYDIFREALSAAMDSSLSVQ